MDANKYFYEFLAYENLDPILDEPIFEPYSALTKEELFGMLPCENAGILYELGSRFLFDPNQHKPLISRGKMHLSTAFENGHPDAHYALYKFYMQNSNPERAMLFLCSSADMGSWKAMSKVADEHYRMCVLSNGEEYNGALLYLYRTNVIELTRDLFELIVKETKSARFKDYASGLYRCHIHNVCELSNYLTKYRGGYGDKSEAREILRNAQAFHMKYFNERYYLYDKMITSIF